MSYDVQDSAKIPADIERPDKILAGLTARQVAILATASAVLWLIFLAVRRVVPGLVFAGAAAPFAVLTVAVVLGSRDGLSLDRLAVAALRQVRAPRRLVTAPEGAALAPQWAGAAPGPLPAPLRLPACAIRADGVADLGPEGAAVLIACSTVSFALATPAEQEAMVGVLARWLNSLTGPAQVVIRAERVDLGPAIERLEQAAPSLPHPALEEAALEHAAFLAEVAASRDLLFRQVLVILREPATGAGRDTAAARALRRGETTTRALAAAGIAARVLDGTAGCRRDRRRMRPVQPCPGRRPGHGDHQERTVRRPFPARPAHTSVPPSTIGPAAVEVRPRTLRLADGVCASFAITGYPAEVPLGWLEPLLTDPGRVDVALHIEPIPSPVAADRLRRQLARLEASSRASSERGRLADFQAEAAADDATELAARLARGQGKLFRAGLYITVHARDDDELHAECERVRALAASLLLDAKPASWRSLQGWVTTLPLGVDALRMRRTMDTDALAAAFPFTSPDLAAPATGTAVLYGLNTASSSLVIWDRLALDNYNSVVLARTGSGKSFFTKLELLRSLYAGVEVAVIDPENEYTRLCAAAGGTHIRLGAPGVRLNPFDLPAGAASQSDALTRRALFLHTVTAVLLGEQPSPAERAALDRAIVATYTSAGITADPRTWARPAPLLKDLTTVLARDGDPAAVALASRIAPYVTGSWRGLFDGPATVRPEGTWSCSRCATCPTSCAPLGTLLTLDAIWRRVTDPGDRRRRLVVVDEGWLLMREPEGARFLFRLAKSARKHWAA